MNGLVKLIALDTRDAPRGETLDLEVRFSSVSETGEIEGTAVTFNVTDSYRTQFTPTTFGNVRGPLPMLWSHDPAQVIGSWTTVEIRESGLAVKGKLNLGVAKAQEARSLLQAGDVTGLSVGFHGAKYERLASGVRRITEARLHEISVVAFASVPGSKITSVRHESAVASFVNSCREAARALNREGKS